MIDLSFLTEEEQEAIMKVLQRDAELKKAEEDRVRVLEDTVEDNNELKNKTGQWFYEAKSKRHRDKIHGADLIRASIRKKKPQTIAELSQSRTDKSKKSWVNNVNKDIFIPPELFGVMEEPENEEEEEKTQAQFYRSVPRVDNLSLDEAETSVQKAVSSPSKQRKNPFNDAALGDEFALTSENGISENGSPHLQQIPGKDQAPIYAQIKSPRVSKLDSTDIQQDQQPLHAEVKSPQVSKHNSTDHDQGSEEELNPVLTALKRSSTKPMPSKSLEDISAASSKPGQVDLPREEYVISNEDDQKADQQEAFYETIPGNSTVPSYPDHRFSDPEKLKRLSKSVPDFLQDESDDRETDSTSEGSFQLSRHKKSPSSLTNLSGSSGMASLSSVSGSVMSIYSGDFGNVDIKGNIQFAIDYVEQLREFHIFVAQCKDLAVADLKKHRSDPYVKTYLLPDKEKMGKRKTAVRKKTLNPAYNEILRYKINKQVLLTQKLNISVWHNDTFGRNSFLGEVDMDLATWDWTNKQMNWYPLQPRTPAAGIGLENRGEINIALMYTSKPTAGKNTASSGEVHIWVKSCSNLPMLRGNRINSFVKCTVLPDTSRKSRQKTRSVDKTVNPVFNHTMVYDGFRPEDLREACVELTVWDHNRLVNHFLGGLRLGLGSGKSYGTPVDWMDSTSYEASLWKKMINSPDEWVEDTLQLRMLMMAKMAK